MRSSILSILMATTMMTGTAQAADLVLKRAVLGTGGVGYFEYQAEVSGKETLMLRARLDQVDDILKSVLILDPAGAGSATLPGKARVDDAFASLPFAKSDLDTMPALFSALKGAEIKLAGPRQIEGRIASVQSETVTAKDGATTTRTRVSVFSGASIEQFILEKAEGLGLATLAEAAKASDEAAAEMSRLEEQRETIISDQDRLRENLKSAPQGSDLARLYAQKMLAQENALDKLDRDIKDVRERYEQARKLLGDKVRTFKS
jgi:hypothetical protein